jgi:membrane protein DedA with SNARE-associated domain
MQQIIDFILNTVDGWGYWGVFILMVIESSFIPFPSEVVIVPAGYLAYQGKMSLTVIILLGTLGSLVGALINYYLSIFIGRAFIIKFGRYFLITEDKLEKSEDFFKKHGSFSTFTGRLIPVIRQLISIPAGLSRMNIIKFSFYTPVGSDG